jgi:hypothetical protein
MFVKACIFISVLVLWCLSARVVDEPITRDNILSRAAKYGDDRECAKKILAAASPDTILHAVETDEMHENIANMDNVISAFRACRDNQCVIDLVKDYSFVDVLHILKAVNQRIQTVEDYQHGEEVLIDLVKTSGGKVDKEILEYFN